MMEGTIRLAEPLTIRADPIEEPESWKVIDPEAVAGETEAVSVVLPATGV